MTLKVVVVLQPEIAHVARRRVTAVSTMNLNGVVHRIKNVGRQLINVLSLQIAVTAKQSVILNKANLVAVLRKPTAHVAMIGKIAVF